MRNADYDKRLKDNQIIEAIELMKNILWVMERIWKCDEPPLVDEDNEPIPITEQRKAWEEKHGE